MGVIVQKRRAVASIAGMELVPWKGKGPDKRKLTVDQLREAMTEIHTRNEAIERLERHRINLRGVA